MIIAPWMWGLGVLGIGAAGVVAYEVVKAGPAGGSTKVAPPPPPSPVLRVAVAPIGTFGGPQPPPGALVIVSPGQTATQSVPQTQYLVLELPPDSKWVRVVTVDTGAHQTGQIGLGIDFTSAIAFTAAQLGANAAVVATWIDAAGATQSTTIPFIVQKVVALHP